MLKRWLKDIHWPLFFAMAGLAVIGSAFIYSAAYHDSGTYETKQLFWALVAVAVFFATAFFGYRSLLGMAYLLYAVAILFLIIVLVLGETRLGAQRWLNLGPIAFQPSEFAKLATILALANFLGSYNRWEKEGKIFLAASAIALLPFALIVKQPDLGTSLMFIPMLIAMLLIWGIRYRYFIFTAVGGLLAMPLMWGFLKEYQRKRILVFLDPNQDPLGSGYTAIQSKIAVGSGGLFGKGYLAGTQSQLQFVPEHHTDFIFCVIGEEWGFAGALLLLILYGLLFRAAFQVVEHTTDLKAKLLVAGIAAVIFSQLFINIGMTVGLMPITGITLPLVSYGGSSLVMTAIALGLVLSVYKERSIF
ncbi:MAG: rod shape-determining protein RodA [Candidatus Omnitrophica bacterium]|nr:rod shape-determining protein RodA [Candidatus Omnitrophota bacterium]